MIRISMTSGAFGAATILAALWLPASAHAISFNAAVEQVLLAQRSGPLTKLNDDNKREMVACVVSALAGVPDGRKRYVTQGATPDEVQDRFGEVVMENRAEWKQYIAKRCAGIATRRQPK
jgi:hypothetical protein